MITTKDHPTSSGQGQGDSAQAPTNGDPAQKSNFSTTTKKPVPPGKRRRKWIIISVVTLLVLGGAAYAFFRKKEVIPKIQTEQVTRRNLIETVLANGKIQPVLAVVINPEVSGEITDLPVKEGQEVKKGDLLLKIKPDNYLASRNSAEANYKSSLASQNLARANREKAEIEFKRINELFEGKLVSESAFLDSKTSLSVANAQFETSTHQVAQAKASMARTEDDLAKTTIYSPIEGTVTKLRSQKGERVVGTAMMAGTEIMTISNLEDMEARVDIGEMDIVLIQVGQKARLEVDAFKDKKFTGEVYEIANAAKGDRSGSQSSSSSMSQQEATKFEVKIRVTDKENFRPGMSVTSYVETRGKSNVLSIPIQSVTTRLPQLEGAGKKPVEKKEEKAPDDQQGASDPKKKSTAPKPVEVVFVVDKDTVRMVPVKRGINDDDYVEIVHGLNENQVVVSGGYKVINRELEDGKKIIIDNEKAGDKKVKK